MHADDPGWFPTPITADVVRGALDLETTEHGVLPHRLPAWARRQIPDDQLAMAESQPSGVRLVFRTRATAIELEVLPTKMAYVGAPPRPDGFYDLVVDGRLAGRTSVPDGNVRTMDLTTGSVSTRPGRAGTVRFTELPAGMKDVQLWLPHNETTELVGLRTDAPAEVLADHGGPVWLHHGSSISHGSNAESPTGTWPAVAALRSGVELVNLGFGGSALLDPFTARAMRDTPADLISVKIGINLVNTDLMRLRAFAPAVHGFLDTVRDNHPSTPLLVVSPLFCPIHERTPGPAAPDLTALAEGRLSFVATGDPADRTRLTLEVIREELARITSERAVDDPELLYLDGRELYGEADFAELPLPDQLHPDTATHQRIGERFARRVLDGFGSAQWKTDFRRISSV
ncbi:MAG TPA: SGNH/GDSL hydrolase family protein [Marmoricola sp.]|nr:SGNH/GDSL hydrolase family protein [Marmoricola sp.]